jgi:hypothetical protein
MKNKPKISNIFYGTVVTAQNSQINKRPSDTCLSRDPSS